MYRFFSKQNQQNSFKWYPFNSLLSRIRNQRNSISVKGSGVLKDLGHQLKDQLFNS